MARAAIFFANGLEECEGLVTVDILRRAGVKVDIAAVGGSLTITSSHKVTITCDKLAEDLDASRYDAAILPGGLPGTDYLEASPVVRDFCQTLDSDGRLVCAICAAPGALATFGILKGGAATVYPGREDYLQRGGATYTAQQVTVDGNHITGEALGAVIPFALEIAAALVGREKSDKVRAAIVYKG